MARVKGRRRTARVILEDAMIREVGSGERGEVALLLLMLPTWARIG